jgi:hypothetical protein
MQSGRINSGADVTQCGPRSLLKTGWERQWPQVSVAVKYYRVIGDMFPTF